LEQRLIEFKSDLSKLPAGDIYAKYIACDECAAVLSFDITETRHAIAQKFAIQVESVRIVGSAKLGFTLREKQKKRYSAGRHTGAPKVDVRPRFSFFSENSDIDVAIVSEKLFDDYWKKCFSFWSMSGYDASDTYWRGGRNFRDYIFRGWMRPDKLPTEGSFTYSAEWFDYFRELTAAGAAGDYKINAGIYREDYFLQEYQKIAIAECASVSGSST